MLAEIQYHYACYRHHKNFKDSDDLLIMKEPSWHEKINQEYMWFKQHE